MKRLGILMLAMAILMLFGCETAVPEEIATAPAYDIQAQLEKAERLFLEGNYEEVILTLDTVLEIEPANVQGYLRLSDAYIARGESYKALELLKRGQEKTGDVQITARILGMTEQIDEIADVAAGNNNTLLLDDNGNTYWCGEQFGIYHPSSNSHSLIYAPYPVEIQELPAMKWVYADKCVNYSSVGVTQNGELYVWGDPGASIIGKEDSIDGTPIKLWEGVKKAFRSGELFCLVLKEDGSVYTRGENSNGRLGTGQAYVEEAKNFGLGKNYSNYDKWLFVMDEVRDIGYYRYNYVDNSQLKITTPVLADVCLAITENNQLYGWGFFGVEQRNGEVYKRVYNQPVLLLDNVQSADVTLTGELFVIDIDGKLKHISIEKVLDKSDPVFVPIPGEVIAVSCGFSHICVIDATGMLYTSGSNTNGELGIAKGKESSDFQEVFKPLEDIPVRKASAGNKYSCAILNDGRLLSWGDNEYGQLGNGRMGMQKDIKEPTKVLERVRCLFSETVYSKFCSALQEDGILFQVSNTNGNVFTPVASDVKVASGKLIVTEPGELKEIGSNKTLAQKVVYVASNDPTQFYIDEAGNLWGRGNNYSGELGIGSKNNSTFSSEQQEGLDEFVFIMSKVAKCATSGSYLCYNGDDAIVGETTLILTESGDVYQCGTNPNTFEIIIKPEKIASHMRDITISGIEIYLIGEDKGLYVLGNYFGTGRNPKKVHENVQKISGSYSGGGLFLDTEGRVYRFGRSAPEVEMKVERSEWGVPIGVLYCEQIELPDKGKDINVIGGDYPSYFVVLENGDLYVWGDNQYGQLGLGDAGSDEIVFEVKLPA